MLKLNERARWSRLLYVVLGFISASVATCEQADSSLSGHSLDEFPRQFMTNDTTNADAAASSSNAPVTVVDVLWMTTLMAAAGALGAVPFFFFNRLSSVWEGFAKAVASGVMIGASFDLIKEAQVYGINGVIAGVIAGCAFICLVEIVLEPVHDLRFLDLRGASARKILIFCGVMAAHAAGEGAGVGVSFVGKQGWLHGLLVMLAIGIHNVPEGLATATVLTGEGNSPSNALLMTLLVTLPQPIFAVLGFSFINSFQVLLPVSMGFAAGCMLWIVMEELLPESLDHVSAGGVSSTATLSVMLLEALRVVLLSIEMPNMSLTGTIAGVFPTALATMSAVAAADMVKGCSHDEKHDHSHDHDHDHDHDDHHGHSHASTWLQRLAVFLAVVFTGSVWAIASVLVAHEGNEYAHEEADYLHVLILAAALCAICVAAASVWSLVWHTRRAVVEVEEPLLPPHTPAEVAP